MHPTTAACIIGALLLGTSITSARLPETGHDAFYYNRLLGRGINLGNALEQTPEGLRNVKLDADYFPIIRRAGFNSVRIPIRWSSYAGDDPPFKIDPGFFNRADWVVDQVLSRGMVAVIDVHHYDEMNREPEKHLPRLRALWEQIANHYRGYPDRLYFELLNEPRDALTDQRWQETTKELLQSIRGINPNRIVIVGPSPWNNLNGLETLWLPESDRRLIATFHYYDPVHFTHQGAEWVKGSDEWKGTTWDGTAEQRKVIEDDFDRVAAWSTRTNRPVYLGEFGAYSMADIASRALWTRAVARSAEGRRFSWSYWEFNSGFGAYDPKARAWRGPILRALMEEPGSRSRR